MADSDFYTPPDIPGSIRAFDSEIRQLAAGEAGKNGALRLVFRDDGAGRTVVADQFSEAPLHAQRAMHYDGPCPGMAYLYIVSTSGGILQGDRYRIDITMKKGSMAHVTTQGATRIYSMEASSATQMINVTLEEDSYLEFIPDQIIPYRCSRFYQRMNLDVHDSATVVYSEVITPGRVAMGESFEYDVCHIKTRAANQEGVLRLMDVASLEPKKLGLASFGVLGDSTVAGSVYILAKKEDVQELHGKIRGVFSGAAGVSGGASTVKDGGGLLVRVLGDGTEEVKGTVLEVVRHVRETCAGLPFSGVRKT